MKTPDGTSKDGYRLCAGMFVRVAPQAFDKPTYMTARVIQPGPSSSMIQPANHKVSVWCENRFITVHKSKCRNRDVELIKQEAKEMQVASQLNIPNTYAPADIPVAKDAGKSTHIVSGASPVTATADDFDALANLATRLRDAAHAKLMKLAEDERTAKQMLKDAQERITAHLNQCRGLGIDLGDTKQLPKE